MTSATAATVGEEDGDRWSAPVPRAERRRRRRERRAVMAAGAVLLALLVGVVTAVLGHLRQGRSAPPRGINHVVVAREVHVRDRAA